MNLLMAMARVGMLLRRTGSMIDDTTRVTTVMVSSLDLQAIRACMVELVELRRQNEEKRP